MKQGEDCRARTETLERVTGESLGVVERILRGSAIVRA